MCVHDIQTGSCLFLSCFFSYISLQRMFCLTQFLLSKFSNTVESLSGLQASEVKYSQVTSHDDTASSF